ncbi:hypothetical protein MLD38_039099 [Melastoma candidum]|uniref:Uncharacterized protein n=1 Tax=Melastoma candidum TaxID=119954 RepID=A0ACB9L105_9MYRT|nr:hypothetical protein MLD38_039099 [Melastoma candidum]
MSTMEGSNGDYVRLEQVEDAGNCDVNNDARHTRGCSRKRWWLWVLVVPLCVAVVIAGIHIFLLVAKFVIGEYIIPFLNWLSNAVDPKLLALMIFGSMSLFPIVLLPSSPSMWIAGIAFGYKIGFLIVLSGISMGVTLPYFIGSLFRERIHRYMEKNPEQASIIKLASEGDFFHQFKAVTLIRLSPFPYAILNYAFSVTDITYLPYFFGSLVGSIPDMLLSLYSGILLHTLADGTGKSLLLARYRVPYEVVGFLASLVITVTITMYAARTTKTKQKIKEPKQQLSEEF